MADWADIGNLKDPSSTSLSNETPQLGNSVSMNSKGDIIVATTNFVSGDIYSGGSGTNSGILVCQYLGGQAWKQIKESSNYLIGTSNSNGGIVSVAINSNEQYKLQPTISSARSINGNLILGFGADDGNVYIKQYDAYNDDWNTENINTASGTFGDNLAFNQDGYVVAIADSEKNSNIGEVSIYQTYPNTLTGDISSYNGLATISGPAVNSNFGQALDLNYRGDIVIVGAPQYTQSPYTNRGLVQIYGVDIFSTGANSQIGSDILGESGSEQFGYSVAINKSDNSDGRGTLTGSTVIAIGSLGHNSNTGRVRVYEYSFSSEDWVQRGSDLNGGSFNDKFGISVSLNSDGSIVTIGASQDAYGTTNGGYVKNYEWDSSTSTWNQKGSTISGSQTAEAFGTSVSSDSTGLKNCIGVPKFSLVAFWGSTYTDVGRVANYEYTSDNKDTIFLQLQSTDYIITETSFFNSASNFTSGSFQPSSEGFITANNETSILVDNNSGSFIYYDFFDGISLPDPYTKVISTSSNIFDDGAEFIGTLTENRILFSNSTTGAHSGIILDISNLLCLAPFTLIKTKKGLKEVRKLKRGDEILTLNGYKKLAKKIKTALLSEKYVKFPQNCFKQNVPERDLYITKDHPFSLGLKSDKETWLWLEAQEFIGKLGIEEVKLNPGPSYNLVFDDQETFYAEGLKLYSHHPNGVPYILKDEDFIGEPKREERKIEKVYWDDLIKDLPEDMELNHYIGNLLKFN